MKWIDQSFEIVDDFDGKDMLLKIEKAARLCYKSEARIKEGSAEKLIANCIKVGHGSMLEHASISVKFITDRSTTHQLVRHRICSFNELSQRYVKFDDVVFINQVGADNHVANLLHQNCEVVERDYRQMVVNDKVAPQIARAILPNCTATEIVVTANLREWRHIFQLRCNKAAHPQIRALMTDLCKEFKSRIPVIFDDIEVEGE